MLEVLSIGYKMEGGERQLWFSCHISGVPLCWFVNWAPSCFTWWYRNQGSFSLWITWGHGQANGIFCMKERKMISPQAYRCFWKYLSSLPRLPEGKNETQRKLGGPAPAKTNAKMPLALEGLPLTQGMTDLLSKGPGRKCFRLNRPHVVSMACLSSFKNILQPFKKYIKSIFCSGLC